MQIKMLSDEQLLHAAQKRFVGKAIVLEPSDIYLKGKQTGRYHVDWLDHDVYISTEYAYEDRIINGNKTRYKVQVPCVLIKEHFHDIIYDSRDIYYAAYMENDEICFMRYVDLIVELGKHMELQEKLESVSQCGF